MTTNKFSGYVSSRRTRIVDRAWLYFLFGLALLMGALLIGPRVADQDQQSICVGNIDLLGSFGFSLNCDSPQFMALARDPSALLEPKNARQARPGLILAAALIQAPLSLVVSSNGLPARSIENGLEDTTEIVRSFDRDLPRMVKKLKLPEIRGVARFPRLLAAGRPLRCQRYNVTIERWREWLGKPRTNILTIRDRSPA